MTVANDLVVQADRVESLWQICHARGHSQAQEIAFTYLGDESRDEPDERHLTYGVLDEQARRIAAALQRLELVDKLVLLMFPNGLEYIVALMGCIYAGAIAVPAFPIEPLRARWTLSRLKLMLASCSPEAVLAKRDSLGLLQGMLESPLNGLRMLSYDELLESSSDDWSPDETRTSQIALVQYTSGSTTQPRGVMVTHGNILFQGARYLIGDSPDAAGVSWLPMFHDMGLFGGVFAPLYVGRRSIFMQPTSFVLRPMRWLEAMSQYRCTISGAPTFGYELCANKARQEDIDGLDLSNWKIAIVGAEKVRAETLEQFAQVFEPCGFRMEAFLPAFGLAEAGLGVTAGVINQRPVTRTFLTQRFEHNQAVQAEPSADPGEATRLIGCGQPLDGLELRIVNPITGEPQPDSTVGEIWVRGPGIAEGYWNEPEQTRLVFCNRLGEHADYLRTGDLGFLLNGELFVTGRIKELIIIGGRNIYPNDIEQTASQCDRSMRGQAGAAVSIERAGRERLVIVHELRRAQQADHEKLIALIRWRIQERHQVPVDGVVLVRPNSIPRTTSGKVQRSACRDALLENRLEPVRQWFSTALSSQQESAPPESGRRFSAQEILDWLTENVSHHTGVARSEIDSQEPLAAYVLDSINIVAMGLKLQDWLGREISPAVLVQAASLADLSQMLASEPEPAVPDAQTANCGANGELDDDSNNGARLAGLSLDEKRQLLKQLLRNRTGLPPPSSSSNGTEAHAVDLSPPGDISAPLSRGQQALWFLQQAAPETAAYNFLYVARIASEVNVAALCAAFRRLGERHAALRTTFPLIEGRPLQQIDARSEINLRLDDAPGLTDEELLEKARAEADVPFDLAHGPLFRATLLRRGAADFALMVVVHHIIADLWSMDVLLEELAALYTSERTGAAADLHELAAGYLDHVRWQENLVGDPRGQALWRQWEQRLAGAAPLLELPTTKIRPLVPAYRGRTISWMLDTDLASALNQLARTESTTLFVTILSAFEILLARISGQRDFLVGTVTLGRQRAELESVVGYFLNQLPLRVNLPSELTFRKLLTRTREEVVGALELEEFPFVELVDRLRPPRIANRHPLFQVMFVWNKPRGEAVATAGSAPAANKQSGSEPSRQLHLERIVMEQRGAPFELTLIVMELGKALRLSFTYDRDLFEDAFIERMREHLEMILRAAVVDPDMPALALPILSVAQQHQILAMSQGPSGSYNGSEAVHRVLERQVRRTPRAVAVESSTGVLTYDDLNRRANRWARKLVQLGVRGGDRVGILMDRNADQVTAIIAIWKAGAAYVPLDLSHPPSRLDWLIQDSRVRLVLSRDAVRDRVPSSVDAIFTSERFADGEPDDDLPTIAGAEDLAYVLYTSGSTGVPKGVMAHHRGVCHLIEAIHHDYEVHAEDRVLLFSSLSFDASVVEILMPLSRGATLVIGDDQHLLVGECMARTLADRQITILTVPPSVLATVGDAWSVRLTDLRLLNVAGEPCPRELVAVWAPGRTFFNAYGPTETTVWATIARCQADEVPTIGRPILNTRVYILDDQLQLVPLGVHGELCVAGPGVTLGYLNQHDLTADRFVPDPHAGPDVLPETALLYRTGDRARCRHDGQIEYLGRLDRQVKVRGIRIETGEIEATLLKLPGVKHAVVTTWRDSRSQRQLVAYIVVDDRADLTTSELRASLSAYLPAYMVPSRFIVLDDLPRLASGKVDLAALPPPDASRPGLDVSYVAPVTPVQQSLATIWSEIIEVENIGIHDNFFELGGTSLDLVQVMSKAREAGLDLSIEMLLARQTIAELSAVCERAQASIADVTPTPPAPEISEAPTTRPARATAAANMIFESIGVYLPRRTMSTDEVIAGCANRLLFPLEKMTGIRSRPVVSDDEFSIDLARRAVADCLARSRWRPEDIDVVICCNISRCDGPYHFSYEPSTAARLQGEFGFSRAICFDISNACAGFFTALSFCESLLRSGAAQRGMVVSGEYISHLTRTAQREIADFLDPRVACLTLGDSGVAATVELADHEQEGFQSLDLMTAGEYADLCVAKVTDGCGQGAIMLTDVSKSTQVAVRHAVRHALATLRSRNWRPDDVDFVIIHQTSSTTIKGVIRELNRAFGRAICNSSNTLDNLAERGNMGSNSILVALVDGIRRGVIGARTNVVFGISGSGQVIGTGLYRMGDLPVRLLAPMDESARRSAAHDSSPTVARPCVIRLTAPVRIESVAAGGEDAGDLPDALKLAANSVRACLQQSAHDARDVGLLVHVGVYRNDYLSEPALAAMIAREAELNHTATVDDEHQTLACDLLSGGTGFLHACFLASNVLLEKNLTAAIVTASEFENNRNVRPDHLLNVVETGSAVLLERSPDGREGFFGFAFLTLHDHVAARVTHTEAYQNMPALRFIEDPRWIEHCLDGVERAVVPLLADARLTMDEITTVMTSQPSREFRERLADRLGIDETRIVELSLDGKDPFTSAIPLALRRVRADRLASSGSMTLLVEVGAGLTVACALYRC